MKNNIKNKVWNLVKLSVFTFPLSVFVSCSQEEDFSQSDATDAVKVVASINKMQTRVAYSGDNGVTNFVNGDAIKVVNLMRTSKNEATYTTTDGTNWTTTDAMVWNSSSKNKFQAYYPVAEYSSYDMFTIPTDQSDATKLASADWMTASTEEIDKPGNGVLDLNFQHRLAKVTVNLTFSSQYPKGNQYVSKFTFLTNEETPQLITPLANSETSYTAILRPGEYADESSFIYLMMDNFDEHYVLGKTTTSAINLEAGKHYTFTLKVGKDVVSIDDVTVADWEEEEIDGGVAEEIPFLTFSAEEEQTFHLQQVRYSLHESVEYSVNGGEWTKFVLIEDNGSDKTSYYAPITFGGDKGNLRMRGKSAGGMAIDANDRAFVTFGNSDVYVACSGDIRTLVDYANYTMADTKDARFSAMFYGCTSLISAPALPATTLAEGCYEFMFFGCTSLISAPALPATTLADYCYNYMFKGCTNLTSAPALPATTLAEGCYNSMFSGCTNLTSAPALPATTLAEGCYYTMFYGCTNLNSVTMLATDVSAESCLWSWLAGVSATGTFIKAAAMESLLSGSSGIPEGWDVENE